QNFDPGTSSTFNNITINKSAGIVELITALDVDGELKLQAGTLDANGLVITCAGNWNNVGGTFTHGNNTVTFNGDDAGKTINAGSSSFYTLTINSPAGTGYWTLDTNNLNATTINITKGTLDVGTGKTITVTGTLTVDGGTITGTANDMKVTAQAITYTSGNIFTAASGDIILNSTGTVGIFSLRSITSAGSISIGSTSAPSSINCTPGTAINSNNGAISITAAGDITLAGINSGSATTTITSTGGHIYGNNSDTVTANSLILSAGSGKNIGQSGGKNLLVNVATDMTIGGSSHSYICIYNSGAGGLMLGNMTASAVDFNGALTVGVIGTTGGFSIGTTYIPTILTINERVYGYRGITINATSLYMDAAAIMETDYTNANITLNGSGDYVIGNLYANSGTITIGKITPPSSVTIFNYLESYGSTGISITSTGTITHNAGRIYTSAGGVTFNGTSVTVRNIASAGSISLTASGNLIIYVDASYAAGSDFTSIANAINATTSVGGTFTINIAAGTYTETVTLNKAATLALSGTVTVNGALNISSGIFNSNGQQLTVTGLTTVNGGTYQTGSAAQTLTGGLTFSIGTITQGTGTITIRGDMTVSTGVTFTKNSSGLIIFASGTANQKLTSAGIDIGNIRISANTTNTTLTLQDAMDADNITIDSAQTLSTGPGNSAISCAGNWTNNGGTFTPGTDTVTFNGTAAQAINGTATTQIFFNFTISKSAGTLSVSGSTTTLTIAGDFRLTIGTFSAPTTINVAGSWIKTGGTFTHNNRTVNFNGTGTGKTINSGGSGFYTLTINSSNGNGYWTLDTNNLTGVTINITSGTLNTGTLNLGTASGTTATTINVNGGVLTGGGGTINARTLNVTLGTLTTGSGGVVLGGGGGPTARSGVYTHSGGSVDWITNNSMLTYNSFNTHTLPQDTYYNLTLGYASSMQGDDIFTLSGETTIRGNLVINAGPASFLPITLSLVSNNLIVYGSLTINSYSIISTTTGNITVGGSWTNNGGTFTPGTGAVTFNGTLAQNITSNDQPFYNFTVNKASGSAILLDPLSVSNNLTISDGTLDANGETITLGGNWTNNDNFISNDNTVIFNDNSKVSTITGNTTFFNLRCVTPDKQLTFTQGSTQRIDGTLTLTGTAGHLIVLRSSVSNSYFYLNDQGTESVTFVDVKDSSATNTIIAANSRNSGHNSNWDFSSTVLTWLGITSTD
ncbi:MAG: hypothetical protein WCT15_06695, partial [Candidatus Omnitrophota bacterium]